MIVKAAQDKRIRKEQASLNDVVGTEESGFHN